MQKTFFLFVVVLILTACSQKEINEEFSFEPKNPKSGEIISIYFNSDSSVLKSAEKITMNAYLFDSEITETIGSEMVKEGNYWKSDIKTNPETKGVFVKFLSGETEETNDGKSFIILLNEENPEAFAKAKAGYASALTGWGRYAGQERDAEKAIEEFEKVFSEYPSIKRDFFFDYLSGLQRAANIEKLKSELNSFSESLTDATDEELYKIYANYKNVLSDNEKAEEFKTKALEKFPNGKFKMLGLLDELNSETEYGSKFLVFDKLIRDFPEESRVINLYDDFAVQIPKDGKFEILSGFYEKYGNKVSPYYRYYAANKILDADGDIELAEKLSASGIDFGRSEYENPTLEKPETSSEKEWKEARGYYLGMNLFIHGKILYKKGNIEEAAKELKEAVDLTIDYAPQEALNNLYVTTLFDLGKIEEVMNTAEEFIKSGNSSEVVLEKLKEAYIEKNNGVKGFDEYMSKYSEMATQMIINELKNEILNEPAPDFTLTDLNGNKVSLSDFKGKNVVLDFWATWCGPCLRSFPGMQLAQEKLEAEGNTKFLFVNTWERVDDKLANAKEFIANNKYPFHVLMDTENDVVTKYKVTGIPTKFIIDKEGNIRFRSIGFRGNTQKIVDEIDVMISLIK